MRSLSRLILDLILDLIFSYFQIFLANLLPRKSKYCHFACGEPVENPKISVDNLAISVDNLGINVENFY